MSEIQQLYNNVIGRLNMTNLSKNNMKYMTFGLGLLFSLVFVNILSQFLFYILFFVTICKSLLWLCEYYDNTNANNTVDLLEYFIVFSILLTITTPLSYISTGFLSLISSIVTTFIGISCFVNKTTRQNFCLFFKNMIIDKNIRDNDNNIVNYSKTHKIIKQICFSIDQFCENPMNTFETVITYINDSSKINEKTEKTDNSDSSVRTSIFSKQDDDKN